MVVPMPRHCHTDTHTDDVQEFMLSRIGVSTTTTAATAAVATPTQAVEREIHVALIFFSLRSDFGISRIAVCVQCSWIRWSICVCWCVLRWPSIGLFVFTFGPSRMERLRCFFFLSSFRCCWFVCAQRTI